MVNSSVQSVVALAFRAAAMGLAAVSLALVLLELESTAIVTLAVGLFSLAVAGFLEPGHEPNESGRRPERDERK